MKGAILGLLLVACGGAVDDPVVDFEEASEPADVAGAEPLESLCTHELYSDWIDETVSPPVAHSETFDAAYVDGQFLWQGQPTAPRFEISTIGIIELSYSPGDFRVTVNGELLRTGGCVSQTEPPTDGSRS